MTVDPPGEAVGSGASPERRKVAYLVPVSPDGGNLDRPGPGAASAPPDDQAGLTPDNQAGLTPDDQADRTLDDQAGRTPDDQVVEPGGDSLDEPAERADWAWVQEWRAGREPTPWASGIPLVVFSALVVGVAVWVLSAGLADRPVIAILVNLLVAAGLAPAIWLSRGLPVLRWVAAGAAAGIVIGWISAVLMLPMPIV